VIDDMSDAIDMLASGTITVSRPGVPLLVDGRLQSTVGTTLGPFSVSVQPLTGRDVERLPEGLRDREARVVFTAADLRPANPAAGTHGDRVTFDGAEFEVQSAEPWVELGNYRRCVLVRVTS